MHELLAPFVALSDPPLSADMVYSLFQAFIRRWANTSTGLSTGMVVMMMMMMVVVMMIVTMTLPTTRRISKPRSRHP
jgi:hypothetical protein